MDKESELIWEAYAFNPRDSDLDIAVDILDQIFSPGGNLDDQYIEAANEFDMHEYSADEILQAVEIYNDYRRSSSDKIDGSHIIELISGTLGGTQDNEYGWDDYEENSEELTNKLKNRTAPLKDEFDKIITAINSPHYLDEVDPQNRLFHNRRLKEIPRELSRIRQRYYDKYGWDDYEENSEESIVRPN